MVDFEHIYSPEQRREKLAVQKKEFAQILTKIPGKKKKAARAISAQAAFLAVAIEELDEIVIRDGYVEEYQNGESQKGTKKTVAADLLDRYTKTYTTAIKQIVDLLPEEEAKTAKDELTEFMQRRPRV